MALARKAKPQNTASEHVAARMSLADEAYEELKRRLITLEYKPGSYLNEARLCDDIGIGRTPVHQAVSRLVHEGLMEMMPRKGLIVKPISIDDVADIIEVRLVNEVFCAGLAARRISADQLREIRQILERADALAERGDLQEQMMLDREFHKAIAEAAGNEILADILRNLHERSLRIWFVSLNNQNHAAQVREEHWRIFEALVSGDSIKAEDAIRDHILRFKANISNLL